MASLMTNKDKREIAEMTARFLHEMQDRMLSVSEASKLYGWSKSWLYHRWGELGGVKAGGKIFFSRNNLERLIREQII